MPFPAPGRGQRRVHRAAPPVNLMVADQSLDTETQRLFVRRYLTRIPLLTARWYPGFNGARPPSPQVQRWLAWFAQGETVPKIAGGNPNVLVVVTEAIRTAIRVMVCNDAVTPEAEATAVRTGNWCR